MSNIVPFNEMEKMATAVAKSGMFGLKSIEQSLTMMMLAQSEGIHPIKAVMEYDIISGKPALKSTTVLARFQQQGGMVEWIESNDQIAKAKFTHPQGGSITIEWTMKRAQQAELLKNDTWKKFPAQMLRARCIPEGVRAIYPACLNGMYSVEEVAAFTNSNDANIVDVVEIIEEPKISLNAEKSLLQSKLKNLDFSMQDIKQFAEYYNLIDDAESIKELNDNQPLLMAKVAEFESYINQGIDK